MTWMEHTGLPQPPRKWAGSSGVTPPRTPLNMLAGGTAAAPPTAGSCQARRTRAAGPLPGHLPSVQDQQPEYFHLPTASHRWRCRCPAFQHLQRRAWRRPTASASPGGILCGGCGDPISSIDVMNRVRGACRGGCTAALAALAGHPQAAGLPSPVQRRMTSQWHAQATGNPAGDAAPTCWSQPLWEAPPRCLCWQLFWRGVASRGGQSPAGRRSVTKPSWADKVSSIGVCDSGSQGGLQSCRQAAWAGSALCTPAGMAARARGAPTASRNRGRIVPWKICCLATAAFLIGKPAPGRRQAKQAVAGDGSGERRQQREGRRQRRAAAAAGGGRRQRGGGGRAPVLPQAAACGCFPAATSSSKLRAGIGGKGSDQGLAAEGLKALRAEGRRREAWQRMHSETRMHSPRRAR
jgi:hypothetical protein